MSLFRDRAVRGGAGSAFHLRRGLFGAMLILPLYYQVVREESALGAAAVCAAGDGRRSRCRSLGA